MEGDFQVCGNCKRSVASAHFALHEAHCLRFLVLCPECEEPVPGAEMKAHCQNKHQQVQCAMSQKSVKKHLLELHKGKECLEDPIQCKFCELAMNLSKLKVHESHCGSRTERCTHCGQLIMFRVLTQHTDVCRREQAQLREGKKISSLEWKIHCDYCKQMIPENKYVHHMDNCCPVPESVKYGEFGKPAIPPQSLPRQPAGNQTSTAEKDVRPKIKNISRLPLLSESSKKQAPRGKHWTMDLPLKSELQPRAASPVEAEAFDILRQCSQCRILLPLPLLHQHQEKCRLLASTKGKQVRKAS